MKNTEESNLEGLLEMLAMIGAISELQAESVAKEEVEEKEEISKTRLVLSEAGASTAVYSAVEDTVSMLIEMKDFISDLEDQFREKYADGEKTEDGKIILSRTDELSLVVNHERYEDIKKVTNVFLASLASDESIAVELVDGTEYYNNGGCLCGVCSIKEQLLTR